MLVNILLAVALATAPVLAVSQNIYEGGWPDGTSAAWQCQKGANGDVKFVFVLPDGKKYSGVFSCGTGV